jgi:hypothetical protein
MASRLNPPSPAQVFCGFGDLPHVATTALTDRLGFFLRGNRIRNQIGWAMRTGGARLFIVVATNCIKTHLEY